MENNNPVLKQFKLEENQIISVKEKITVELIEEPIDTNIFLEEVSRAKAKYNELEDEKNAFIKKCEDSQIEIIHFLDLAKPITEVLEPEEIEPLSEEIEKEEE